jgi:hypothetical protein
LELHTWYPDENSQRCDPAEGTVSVKVFPIRNSSDIRRSDVFKGPFIKNLHRCPVRVHARVSPPFVNPPKQFWYNDSGYYDLYDDGLEIELIRIIGKLRNASLVMGGGDNTEYHNGTLYLRIWGYHTFHSVKGDKFTRSSVCLIHAVCCKIL